MNLLYKVSCLLVAMLVVNGSYAQDYFLEKLKDNINTTTYNEISPSVSKDGNTLFFTRVGYPVFEKTLYDDGYNLASIFTEPQYYEHLSTLFSSIAGESVADPIASGFNQDIWMAHSINGEFDVIQHPSYPLNNALPNSICALTPSANEAIVINQFSAKGGMQKGFSRVRYKEDGSWSFPEAVNINNYHNSGPDVNMTMSSDGNVLILSMEREDAFGRSDLYVCFRTGDNQWSTPKNLGPYVNTVYRETTPYLSDDMRTIYYASDRGNNSVGGSDIFVQTRTDDSWEKWTMPRRFRFPINSRANDSHPYFNTATGYLYFTSNREGSSDIYRIQIEEPQPSGLTIQGIVLNAETMQPESAMILCTPEHNQRQQYIYQSDNGNFRLVVEPDTKYQLVAEKVGFNNEAKALYFPKDNFEIGKTVELTLYLNPATQALSTEEPLLASLDQPVLPPPSKPAAAPEAKVRKSRPRAVNLNDEQANLAVGTQLELEPIYFSRSQATVLHKSYPELDRLARFLKKHPKVHILIAGHTDNQGEASALRKLSKDRAEAIRDYLVGKMNINAHRIKTIGYGASKAINDNGSERLRKLNRRVEVEIIHLDNSLGANAKPLDKK
ncbi:MAG: OmpA family protein [Bacteroidota bacterium]